jgi:hypothetical protein
MIDIKREAKEWLEGFTFNYTEEDLKSLCSMIESIVDRTLESDEYIQFSSDVEYDSEIGSQTLCECGHTYYRHFDSCDGMAPVGCKYCTHTADKYGNYNCAGFKKKE